MRNIIFIFDDCIKRETIPSIMPRAIGRRLPIAGVVLISLLDKSTPRLVKVSISLVFPGILLGVPDIADPSYSASPELTLAIKINPSVRGLFFKDPN